MLQVLKCTTEPNVEFVNPTPVLLLSHPGKGSGGQDLHQVAESPKEDKTTPCTLVTFSSQDIEALFISNKNKNPTKM